MIKRIDERTDETVHRWFNHIDRMGKDKVAKRVYMAVRMGSRSVCRPWKK